MECFWESVADLVFRSSLLLSQFFSLKNWMFLEVVETATCIFFSLQWNWGKNRVVFLVIFVLTKGVKFPVIQTQNMFLDTQVFGYLHYLTWPVAAVGVYSPAVRAGRQLPRFVCSYLPWTSLSVKYQSAISVCFQLWVTSGYKKVGWIVRGVKEGKHEQLSCTSGISVPQDDLESLDIHPLLTLLMSILGFPFPKVFS